MNPAGGLFYCASGFPVGVWMRRALTLLPGLDPAALGADAGLAQQYIFHAIRNGRLAGA